MNKQIATGRESYQKQSKRKIFLDDSHKSRESDYSVDNKPVISKKTPIQIHPQSEEQLKSQIQNLQQVIKQLRLSLKDQRDRYDQLFEEYQELIEKNNLIEKEYINLKYQHNKEIKNLKKTFKDKVDEEIRKNTEDFQGKINDECLWEGIKVKIDKFLANLQRVSQIFQQKSKKFNNDHHSSPRDLLQKLRSNKSQIIVQQAKQQKIQVFQIEQKIHTSPSKSLHLKQSQAMVNNSTKEIIFEDEYFGDIDDYQHLEEKITQRRNFQLMKNCNRNSSQIRRKKIFNKSVNVQ